MTRRLLYITAITASLTFAPALMQQASARVELTELEVQQIQLNQSGKSVTVTGAAGKTLYIYNLVGTLVKSVKIDSNEKRVDLSQLTKGIYPAKVGNVSKKIYIDR